MGVVSVWIALWDISGFFFFDRKELGIRANILLGKIELTWAISNTCICLSDLVGNLTCYFFIIRLIIFTFFWPFLLSFE